MRMGIVLLCSLLLTGCYLVRPGAGEEAVLIDKPYIFGHGGIQDKPITTGSSFAWASTDNVVVNMQPQQFALHFDDLMTSDGVPLDFDAVIRLRVRDSVALIKGFGEKWYANNIEREVSNRVRDAVKVHGMNETAIDTKAIVVIDDEVTKGITAFLTATGIPVDLINFTVGRANPPDSIKGQRIETATQQQRIRTEQERKLAEDQREAAERSRAKADNAYREALGLSGEQFVTLEQIKMLRATCATGPQCTFIIGDGQPVIGRR